MHAIRKHRGIFGRDEEFLNQYWDDLRFPASGLNPPGATSAPEVDTDSGLLLFEDAKTEVVAGLAQLPHSWVEGSLLEPHVHWIQPAVGDVVWRLEYKLTAAVRTEVPDTWTTVDSTDTVFDYPGTGNWVQITRFPSIDMTGYRISAMVIFKLSRLGGDAADTLAADAALMEFDIHYQLNTPGSEREFIKR